MSKPKNMSKVILELGTGDGMPIATLYYKGSFLCKSPTKLSIRTILRRKPKRKDKTYEQRLETWHRDLKSSLSRQISEMFSNTLYADELNKDVFIEMDIDGNV